MQTVSNHRSSRFHRADIWRVLIGIADISLAFAELAHANDTSASIGTGGLQFTKTNELKMEREDLYLSTEQVRVKYIFRNLTEHDVTTNVAFPMPSFDMEKMYFEPHDFHLSGREGDVVDFHVQVNGVELATSIEVRAINHNGEDITELLHRYNIPVTDVSQDFDLSTKIDGLPPEIKKILIEKNAIDESDAGSPWSVKSAYHWQQTFPAKAEITIEHWYKPVVGSAPFGSTGADLSTSDFRKWCPDEALLKAIAKPLPKNTFWNSYTNLDYILKTGANWAGPIGHFRLEIDKGKAALLSTCLIPGLSLHKQANSFTAEADNFTPLTDLTILFLYQRKY